MQKVSTVLAIVLSFLIIALMHFGWLYYMEEGGPAARRVEVRVPPGATLHDVQSVLVELGLLKRPGIFRWAAYLSGSEKGIKTGRYLFRPGESVSKILSKLARGEVDYIRIAIPEGLMLKEISGLLQEKAEIDSIRFVELARDAAFVGEMGIEAPSLEGYLFPDTYLFNWPLTARDVAERIVHRFNEVFGDSMRARADTLGLSVNEVVTLASIIQAEAVFDSEMPRISAVYHNRLRRRWRLE
ncbi:MAG: endolytic transglycosylase MltG, partial [Candidatus Krumholzibacteria bacterium]|nr:endolytic transglycosylase MltG [Candidatus Krumholzibacteria bacterium]